MIGIRASSSRFSQLVSWSILQFICMNFANEKADQHYLPPLHLTPIYIDTQTSLSEQRDDIHHESVFAARAIADHYSVVLH